MMMMMMMNSKEEEGDATKISISNPPPHHYGTFPLHPHPHPHPPMYHAIQIPAPSSPVVGYQQQGQYPYPPVAVEQGVPVGEQPRLPLCGIGIGWTLFLSGFMLAAFPWYVGAFILLFVNIDYREKPGLVACTVAAALVVMPVILRPFHEIFGW